MPNISEHAHGDPMDSESIRKYAYEEVPIRLQQLRLKPEYNTDDDNIIRDLYKPCLEVSRRYDRAVGYFRANIYRELGEDLLNFVISGGKVRIVCSPDIPEPDERAAREGYSQRGNRTAKEIEVNLISVLKVMSENPEESDCLDMLRLLIEKGSLELFIAMRPGGIYHRKIGMFADEFADKVVFSGSGNETNRATSSFEDWVNDEDFDVFRSWGNEFESEKAKKKEAHLTALFSGGTKRTRVRPLNEIEKEYLAKFRSYASFEQCRSGARKRASSAQDVKAIIVPYSYQKDAIKAWNAAEKTGILSMATATGKTYTALFAIEDLVKHGNPILIVVPSKILIDQWSKAISEIYPGVPVLLAGGGHSWKLDSNKSIFVSKVKRPRFIVSTMDTASSDDFLEFLRQTEDAVLIADEVHAIGSPIRRRVLDLHFESKLGLSATPERLFDKEGTQALVEAFGEDPVYELPIGGRVRISDEDTRKVPILGRFLSTYDYLFWTVELNEHEQKDWAQVTNEIRRLAAIAKSRKEKTVDEADRLRLLLIRRSRIVKKAENKVHVVNSIIDKEYSLNGRWIVYCEDEDQLDLVAEEIKRKQKNMIVLKYHSKMSPENRDRALQYFESNPSIIISIRCLDEGLDIPSADGAIILASSTNPRQYIQRRGRVLRKAKDKGHATIVDVIVTPNSDEKDIPYSIVRSEMARAWSFAQNARNREALHGLWEICVKYGVDLDMDAELGMEDECEV
jgi:superfamily II DNA or RNA helicase